jgi:hypothetical protein
MPLVVVALLRCVTRQFVHHAICQVCFVVVGPPGGHRSFDPSPSDRRLASVIESVARTTPKMAHCKRRSTFRPCIDLHDGQVKQIVGGTLSDVDPEALKTNFVARSVCPLNRLIYLTFHRLITSSQSPRDFAHSYRDHNLQGGHVIKLGPRNDDAAKEALAAWPSAFLRLPPPDDTVHPRLSQTVYR